MIAVENETKARVKRRVLWAVKWSYSASFDNVKAEFGVRKSPRHSSCIVISHVHCKAILTDIFRYFPWQPVGNVEKYW